MKTNIQSAVALSLITILCASAGFAQDEPASPIPAIPGSSMLIRFVPVANQSAPRTGRSRGGASRGNCFRTAQALTALVPVAGADEAAPPELTLSDRPTFWFYVPYALSAERPAEFALLDESGEYLYQTQIARTTANGGIIQIKLPESVPALEAGKTYNWTFQVVCESSNPIDIWGSVRRIAPDPDLTARLRSAAPLEQVALYAANGIWYEAIDRMAALYQVDRTNARIAANWASLLQSAGLEAVTAEPMLNCCTAQ